MIFVELLTPFVFSFTVPAVIFAGISKAGFGSSVAFASASILAVFMEPAVALGVMLPLLMLIDVASLPSYWRKWDWSASWVLLLGAVPGTVLGAWFFAVADPDLIRVIIGLVAVMFVLWQTAQSRGWLAPPKREMGVMSGMVAGVALGFTSFISHAGGPVAAVFLLGRGLSKTAFQATTVLVFWAVNLFKSGFYLGLGVFTRETLMLDVLLVPFAILGTWLGIRAHHFVSERTFFRVTYVALSITGGKLIWDGLT
jgi:uncharacterized membrane protein YfcA